MIDTGSSLKHYNISMLRDFLDHLLCELRLARLELSGESDGPAADLITLRTVYRNKYHTTGLLEPSALQNDVESPPEFETAQALFASMFADLRGVEIKRLEELQGLFDESLRCCGQDVIPVQVVSAAELLANSASEDP